MVPGARLNVFEARNKTLREAYVSSSPHPVAELPVRHAVQPPGPIAHWDRSLHQIVYVELERALPADGVDLFIEGYNRATPIPGWKVLRDAVRL